MFDYIPPVFKGQYAETEEEADQWLKDNDSARRTPDLLPATRSRARSTQRSRPAAVPRTAASTSTSHPG